ncbi:MAG: SurA N-terminal domain-containing protein [Acidobacteria bacterium]|nr:SurA N-terminal domain-containing protein [Acidobacteriota bacterium]
MALGYMRRHKKWLYVFLWLVIAAFIVLYVPALDPSNEGTEGEAVVTVGDEPISVAEFRREYYRQIQFYSRLYQGQLDEAQLKRMGIEDQVLQSLVTDRLVGLEADRLGITVSDEAVARAIATAPDYQENGRFIGTGELRRRLELAGTTEQSFEDSLRNQLLRESLQGLVGDGVVVTDAEAEREFRRRTEQVELEYVVVDSERFRDEVEPDDHAIAARFEENPERYRIPEKRTVSYVLLDGEVIRPLVTVTDRDIGLYYQDHREDFREEEESCARHILVKVAADENAEGHTEEEARRIAETLLERVEAGGDFAAIAKASSEDQGSAANGGDLGCFPFGRMVREFDDALYDLEPGQTSGLVRTNFGYHIIRLESRREERVLPLAEVEDQVRARVTEQKMSDLGDEKAQALASALSKGKTLPEAAEAVGLEVKTSAPFARGETPPELPSAALVKRVFEMEPGEVEKEGFSLPQGAAFVALAEVEPSRLPELAEVRDQVRADLVDEAALEKAHALAVDVKARAEKIGLERAATAADLVRKETLSPTGPGQPLGDLGTGIALDEVAFSLPEGTLSDPVRVADGWGILRVRERQDFDAEAFAEEKPRVVASLRQQKQGEAFQAYLGAARERYEIRQNPEAYRRALGRE